MELFKKIISSALIIAIFLGVSGIPERAQAQEVVEEVGPNLFESIVNTANSTVSSASTYSLELKAFVLDTLATTLAKQLIRQITADVVNWINSGFQGSPAFITNPGGFFINVADQITGAFLAKVGGPLTALCSPFSIDIRLALAFKYHPQNQQKYACTLSTIIHNATSSSVTINGKSIDGFLGGDFNQGGWPAFVSLTTEPQNNPYGAYLEANSEIGIRVANAQLQQKDELNQGKGFLSWRNQDCLKEVQKVKTAQRTAETDPAQETQAGADAAKYLADNQAQADEYDVNTIKTETDCPVETPGSLIVSNLETSVNGPLHELELVDSINQIVNALAAQLVSTVLKGGLRAISGSSASDSTSYINQIQTEANNAKSGQLQGLTGDILGKVNQAIQDVLNYKTNKDSSLNAVLDVKDAYESVKECYSTRTNAQSPAKVQEVDTILNRDIVPLAGTLLNDASQADSLYNKLTGIRDKINAAKTVNDINAPTTDFTTLVSSNQLISTLQTATAQKEVETVTKNATTQKQDALRRLQECQVFASPNTTNSNTSTTF